MHRLVGARDVRGAVTVAGAAFEGAAALTADSTTSARALYITRTCRAEIVNADWYAQTCCLPTRQASCPVRRCTPLQGHALSCCCRPFDGGDELVALDSVSEVRHGVSAVVDVCRERRVRTPNVEGRLSFQFRERGPFLSQHRGDLKLGGPVATLSSMDGQGKDLRQCGLSGDPQSSVGSVDLPLEPDTAGHCLTDVDAGSRPGHEGADLRDLIGGCFHDLLPGPFDSDQWPANIRNG